MMSEPIEFWRDIECSGVRSLLSSALALCLLPKLLCVHWRAIVRTQEAHSFFRDSGELEQRHHLKAEKISIISCSFLLLDQPTAIGQDVVIPSLKLMRPSDSV